MGIGACVEIMGHNGGVFKLGQGKIEGIKRKGIKDIKDTDIEQD